MQREIVVKVRCRLSCRCQHSSRGTSAGTVLRAIVDSASLARLRLRCDRRTAPLRPPHVTVRTVNFEAADGWKAALTQRARWHAGKDRHAAPGGPSRTVVPPPQKSMEEAVKGDGHAGASPAHAVGNGAGSSRDGTAAIMAALAMVNERLEKVRICHPARFCLRRINPRGACDARRWCDAGC